MSERERWVVYPLLFLALGAALRDKLFDRTITKSIVCEELTVLDEAGILAQIGRIDAARTTAAHGYMIVNGRLDTDLINSKQFAFRNVTFMPALQTIMSSPWDFLRSLQNRTPAQKPAIQAVPNSPQSGVSQPKQAQAPSSKDENEPSPPAQSSDSDGPPKQVPLADPTENR